MYIYLSGVSGEITGSTTSRTLFLAQSFPAAQRWQTCLIDVHAKDFLFPPPEINLRHNRQSSTFYFLRVLDKSFNEVS